MPELANVPGPNFTDIRKDLAAFDKKFGLPAAKLKVTTTLAGASAPYVAGTEEVEDTEIVHAIAPGASLDVVLVPANATASAANFTAAVTGVIHAAITQNAAVVSISGSKGEHLFTPAEVARLHAALQQAAVRRVTVVATGPSTTWSPATTRCSGQHASSPATRPDPAGTRSPAGAAPTPTSSSPSWRTPRTRPAQGPPASPGRQCRAGRPRR
jgi:hypothetical protein